MKGRVEDIEERVWSSHTETKRCEIHRFLRESCTCGTPRCCCVDENRSARSKHEMHASCCTEFPMRCKSIAKAIHAVDTFNCIGKTAANMK